MIRELLTGRTLLAGILLDVTVTDIQSAVTTLINIIGGAIALIGIVDAFSGYSNQSSGKMSEGIIKAIGGAGIIVIGYMLIPKMFTGL